MKKLILLSLIIFFCNNLLLATHNEAGEIVYKHIDGLTYEISVYTYTNLNSIPADRDSLTVCYGDGSCEDVKRVNGPDSDNNGIPDGEPISPNTKVNIYTTLHTYLGIATYMVSMTDPNRTGGILNVNFPNSENVPFIIEAELTIFNPTFQSPVNSPVFLQAPIDFAFTNEPFMHTPNAFSLDGDSLAYQLVTPVGAPNYVEVTEVGSGSENNLEINEETGLIIWDAPQVLGQYTIAYKVTFYREGQEVGYTIRDMLVEVEEGPGFAPDITMQNITGNEEIILVDLGDTVRLEIEAVDADADQLIEITATCGLFDFYNENATYQSTSNGNTATATFEWIVKEEHLREQAYQLVVKAEDNTTGHVMSKLAVVRYKTNGGTTNTHNALIQKGIKIFPNPVSQGFLNIQIDSQLSELETYTIFNSSGQVIKSGEVTSSITRLDINDFSIGLYFLLLEKGATSYSVSFFKL